MRTWVLLWFFAPSLSIAAPTPTPETVTSSAGASSVALVETTTVTLELAHSSTAASPFGPQASVQPHAARGYQRPPGMEVETALLFVPRLILTPVRWVLSAVYWPLRYAARFIQKHAVVERVRDVLYSSDRKAGIVPTFSFLSGSGLSGGAKLFDEDVFGHGEQLTASMSFGGLYNYSVNLSFEAEKILGSNFWVEMELAAETRPRLYFSGIGAPPASDPQPDLLLPQEGSVETRFREDRMLARLRVGGVYEDGDRIKPGVSVIFNRQRFRDSENLNAGEVSIGSVYQTDSLVGFDQGVDIVELTADLILDYRNHPGLASSGVFVEAFAGGVPPQGDFRYVHYGAEIVGYINLFNHSRVLALRLAVEAVEGDEDHVPFSSLPRLGGPHRLRGYRLNTFRDEKAVLATVEYHYPIHQYVAGMLFVDAGNVDDNYGDLVRPSDLRFGAGGGLILGTPDSISLKLDVSYGDGLQLFVSSDILRAFAGRTEQL